MKVQNLGYNKLMEDSDLCAAFRAEVRDAVAAEADPGFPPERVHLKLRPGSVIVDAEIASLTPGTATAIKSRLNGSASLSQRVTNSVKAIQGIDAVSTGNVVVTDVTAGIKRPPGRDGLAEIEHEVEDEVEAVASNLSDVPQSALAAAVASSFLCLAISLIGCFLICRPRNEAGKGYLLAPDEDLENVHPPPESPKKEEPQATVVPVEEQRTETLPLLAPEVAPQPEQPSEPQAVLAPAVPAEPEPAKEPEKKEEPEGKEAPQPKEKARKKKAPKRKAAAKDANKQASETPRDENTEPQASEPPADDKDKATSSTNVAGQTSSRSKSSGDKRADAAYASYVRLAEDMGFPESQASVALAEAGGNSATALDKLLAQP